MLGTSAFTLTEAFPRSLYQLGTCRLPLTNGSVAPWPRLRRLIEFRPSAPSPWKVDALVWLPDCQGSEAITSATSAAPRSSICAAPITDNGDGESAAVLFKLDPVTTTSSMTSSSGEAAKVWAPSPSESRINPVSHLALERTPSTGFMVGVVCIFSLQR